MASVFCTLAISYALILFWFSSNATITINSGVVIGWSMFTMNTVRNNTCHKDNAVFIAKTSLNSSYKGRNHKSNVG